MDCNENLDTSLDDIYNFNGNTQGANKKKRSSILKQTKKANFDIYENDETDTRRSRLSTKRVSFAERFQVKELHTGHIYDIPGFNESSQRSQASIQLSYESETNNLVGNFPSRSFVPDASVTFQEPTGSSGNRNQTSQDSDKRDKNGFVFEPSLGKSREFDKENVAPQFTSKTIIALLEGKNMVEDNQYGNDASVYSEAYGRKEESMNITSSISHSAWMGDKYLKEKCNIFDDFDLLESQENENGKGNPSKSQFGVESKNVGKGKSSQQSVRVEVDILNKENNYQTSPRFQNLKFIDSPPSSWKSGREKVLKHQNSALPEKKSVDNSAGGIAFVNKNKILKNKENVLAQNQQKGLSYPSEADKENVYYGMVQRAVPNPQISKFVSSSREANKSEMNRTRYSVSAMDLTLMPEEFREDVGGSELDTPDGLDLSLQEDRVYEKTQNNTRLSTMDLTCLPGDVSSSSEPINLDLSLQDDSMVNRVNEKMQNKTRFSTMDLTCLPEDISSSPERDAQVNLELNLEDQVLNEDVIGKRRCVNEKTQNKTRLSTMDLTCLPEDTSISRELDTPADLELSSQEDRAILNKYANYAIGKSEWVNEKTHNKTRLSTCDMEITCAVNYPMNDSSLPVSPSRGDKLDDIGELGTVENNNLNHFGETEDNSPKSSQQSNFSFEEMLQNPPCSDSVNLVGTQPISDIGKQVNSSKLPKKYFESTLINASFGNKDNSSDARMNCFEVPEHKKIEQNLNLYQAEGNAPGRKYSKFSAESENSPDRIQTQSPGKELGDSFMLKNKENLHTNRKRAINSNNKPGVLPLGYRIDNVEANSQSKFSKKEGILKSGIASSKGNGLVNEDIFVEDSEIPANSQRTRLFRSEIMELTCHNVSYEGSDKISTPIMKQVHILTETEISSPDAVFSSRKYEKTRYSTNYMDLTCLPEPEDSSNVLDSFQKGGNKTPSFVSDEVELTCNFKNQSELDTNYSMNRSALKRIEQLSETITSNDDKTGNYADWRLNHGSSNNTMTIKNDKNTQYFTSEAMELTCKTTNFQDDHIFSKESNYDLNESNQLPLHPKHLSDKTLTKSNNKTQYFASQPMEMTCNLLDATTKSDNSAIEGHQVPSYYNLKELPVVDSTNKNSFNCSVNRNVRARQKMFRVVTDDFSASEAGESSVSKDNRMCVSSVLPSNPLDNLNNEFFTSVSKIGPGFRVITSPEVIQKVPEDMVSEKPFPDAVDNNSESSDLRMVKNLPQSRTPGAVYKIRKIKQAFKESSNNLVLFPELSEVLKKKQRFSFKHPYSEMKITSPEIKDSRQNRSFEPSSQENSFCGSSREGSLVPSLRKLSSHFKEPSENVQVPASTEVKSLTQEIGSLNAIVASPGKQPNRDVPRVDCSVASPEKLRCLDASKVCYSEVSGKIGNRSKVDCSMASPEKLRSLDVSKADRYYQVPSIMYDDESLQLLQNSALENSYLEAASKNYTICMDRSDFILKEKCPILINKQPQLLPLDISLQNPNESIMACNYTMSQTDSIAQIGPMSPEKSKIDDKSTSIVDEVSLLREKSLRSSESNKNILTKETHFDFCGRQKMASDLSLQETLTESSLAARLKENNCQFPIASLDRNESLKSSPVNKTRRLHSPERSKSSMDTSLAKTDACPETPTDINTERAFNIPDVHRVISEEVDGISNDMAELSNVQEDLKIVSVAKKTLSASHAVEETVIAHKRMDSSNIQDAGNNEMNTDFQAGVSSTEKQINFVPGTGISMTISNKLQKPEVRSYPEVECGHSSQDIVKEKPIEIIEAVNEEVMSNRVPEVQPLLQNNLNYFEEQLEKAFASEGDRFKLKNLCEYAATFELTWAFLVYKCVMRVDVERISASESSVSFTPVGEILGNRSADTVFDNIEERAYKYFQYLVTDTRLPFPVFSTELIDKLIEYSKITKVVETLMGDLLKVSLEGISVISHELDPLKVTVQAINTNYECICDMIFCVDLKKYPREKIIPEVKHVLRIDITKEVQMAAASVEPGRNYLYRMVDAALELTP